MPREDYEARRAERIERLEARAAKAKAEAEARYARAKEMASIIPFGQPILVGHHSEKRDRNYRAKIENNYRKSFEAADKAKHLEERAAAAADNGAISSDDPLAVEKLRDKLAGMAAERDEMKALNAAWRKAKRPKADDAAGWANVASVLNVEPNAPIVVKGRLRMAGDFLDRAPYTYEITNLGANIKRVEARIAELERAFKLAKEDEPKTTEYGRVTMIEDPAINRVKLVFPGKPSAVIRELLKRSGFRWSPTEGAWMRHLTASGRVAADCVARSIQGE